MVSAWFCEFDVRGAFSCVNFVCWFHATQAINDWVDKQFIDGNSKVDLWEKIVKPDLDQERDRKKRKATEGPAGKRQEEMKGKARAGPAGKNGRQGRQVEMEGKGRAGGEET